MSKRKKKEELIATEIDKENQVIEQEQPNVVESVILPIVQEPIIDKQKELLEKATNYETLTHITTVRKCIDIVIKELIKRAEDHDKSKMEEPELAAFVAHTPKLAGMTYGSEEYMKCLEEIKPALEHHYANNRHHPNHYKNGFKDMTVIDIIEMFCDWKSASLRHSNGNLKKSIELGKERFGMSKDLLGILENSIYLFDDIKD